MSLKELPKTATETTLKLIQLPVALVGKAREVVEKQLGGGDRKPVEDPTVEPTKSNTAKPKTMPKSPPKKPAAKKPAAAKKKPAAKKPTNASAAAAPTPANTASAAERSEVIAEQTDGLDDAVDRAQFELHKRDVNGSA